MKTTTWNRAAADEAVNAVPTVADRFLVTRLGMPSAELALVPALYVSFYSLMANESFTVTTVNFEEVLSHMNGQLDGHPHFISAMHVLGEIIRDERSRAIMQITPPQDVEPAASPAPERVPESRSADAPNGSRRRR